MHNKFLTLPNFFTSLRILLTPLNLLFLHYNHYNIVFILTILVGFSDWADGFFARKLKLETPFGKIYDPIADKIFMISMFIMFGYMKFLPVWLCFLVLARDVLIILIGLIFYKIKDVKHVKITNFSKINTALQILLILIVVYRISHLSVSALFLSAETILIYIVSFFTIISSIQYLKIFNDFLKIKTYF